MSTITQREFHAQRGGLSAGDLAAIVGDISLNAFSQAELLSSALATPLKEAARAHYRVLILGEHGRRSYAAGQIGPEISRLRSLGLERSVLDAFAVLPPYTLGIELTFKLTRPYLSRDDDAFYIIDNPVRKEKVFKVPYVAPTSWKGSLRAAARQGLLVAMGRVLPNPVPEDKAKREEVLTGELWPMRAQRILLFGNEKRNEADFINRWLAERLLPEKSGDPKAEHSEQREQLHQELENSIERYLVKLGYRTEKIEGRQGRLFFFPTYFDQIGLEIINPHDREHGVGKNPIMFECVPVHSAGRFSLLYMPFDYPGLGSDERLAVTADEVALRRQIRDDLPVLADAICELFTVYGFGAKTSSGYGTAEDRLATAGRLVIKARLPDQMAFPASTPAPPPDLPRYLEAPGRLAADFRRSDGSLRSEEEYKAVVIKRGQEYAKKNRLLHDKAKGWWEREGRTLAQQPAPESESASVHTSEVTTLEFATLSELSKVARMVAGWLNDGGGA